MRRRRPLALVLLAATATLAAPSAVPAGAAHNASPSYIAAAEYFGDGNPTNMWSSDLSGAPAAFATMKRDGFNTVGLIVPWGEFQTGVSPPQYDQPSFNRLDGLIRDAASLGMGVILRLSYEWDENPSDQMPGLERFDALYGKAKVRTSWLDYIAAVHRNVAQFHNIREAYISWEDLWAPIFAAQAATTSAQRLSLAASDGYRQWLKSTQNLAVVSTTYGTRFATWTQVPTPLGTAPAFRLMYDYEDWALVHELYDPAAKRYPGLTMESRVDVDPIFSGSAAVGSFTHSAQYKLPGTKLTGMYFSPYMQDPTSTLTESATDASTALHSVLTRMSGLVAGRKLFIYEYEIESNSPAVSHDPALEVPQIPTFVANSEAILHQYTAGYALWTYHDYHQSPLFNQSFALGSAGWRLSGGAHPVTHVTSASYLALGRAAGASQAIHPATVMPGVPATVSFRAAATSPASVAFRWGNGASQSVKISRGWHTYQVTLQPSAVDTLAVKAQGVKAQGQVGLTDVEMYWYSQIGDVYNATGAPEISVAPLTTINHQLTASG